MGYKIMDYMRINHRHRNDFIFYAKWKIAVRRKDIGIWFGQARNKMQNWKYQIGDI